MELGCDGYPTEEFLQWIRDYQNKDRTDLWAAIHDQWWNAKHMIKTNPKETLVFMSTGGWSGNESIIDALSDNFVLWHQIFLKVRAGGHYTFKL